MQFWGRVLTISFVNRFHIHFRITHHLSCSSYSEISHQLMCVWYEAGKCLSLCLSHMLNGNSHLELFSRLCQHVSHECLYYPE